MNGRYFSSTRRRSWIFSASGRAVNDPTRTLKRPASAPFGVATYAEKPFFLSLPTMVSAVPRSLNAPTWIVNAPDASGSSAEGAFTGALADSGPRRPVVGGRTVTGAAGFVSTEAERGGAAVGFGFLSSVVS